MGIVSLFVTVSVILSFLANISCSAVSFYSPLRNGIKMEFGVFMRKGIVLWEDWNGNPVMSKTCFNYDGDFMDPDAKWKTAKAFAIIAIVLGTLLPCVGCCMPKFEKPIGACLLLVCLFQGLTLLILESNLCKNNAVIDLFNAVIPDEAADKRFPTECSRDWGYNCNIACVIFWFISGMLMIALPASDKSESPETELKEQEKELDASFQEEDVEEGSMDEKAL
mmetsp:Transcript_19801/g.35948  ORF Transcript_19801/g.35948 Transcript_19801/m.35948 type:complete len:223 (+) Transcript_19801:409-1077(+)